MQRPEPGWAAQTPARLQQPVGHRLNTHGSQFKYQKRTEVAAETRRESTGRKIWKQLRISGEILCLHKEERRIVELQKGVPNAKKPLCCLRFSVPSLRAPLKSEVCVSHVNYLMSVNSHAYANPSRTYHHVKSTRVKCATGWVNCRDWTQGKRSGEGQYEQKRAG